MSITASASQCLQQALIDGSVGTDPGQRGDWPIYVDHLPDPDTAHVPVNAIAIWMTSGHIDGRLMAGKTIEKPGWQIRVRGEDYSTGYQKMLAISAFLDTIKQTTVTIGSDVHVLEAVHKIGTIFPIRDPRAEHRHEEFTRNGTLTIQDQ